MLPYPIDQSGYLQFPGTGGNTATINRPVLSSLTKLAFTARVRPLGPGRIMGWANDEAGLLINDSMEISIFAHNGNYIGALASSGIPDFDFGTDIWLRAELTIATALCSYWYSVEDSLTPPTAWESLTGGTGVTGTPDLTSSSTVILGTTMPGRIYYAAEFDNDVESIRFDGSQDLAGVPPDATTVKPSVAPVGSLMTINSKALAVSQGFLTLDGNPGNYMEVPDAAALDITSNLAIHARVRPVDTSPLTVGLALISKSATAGQYSFNLTFTTRGTLLLQWSADGTAVASLESDALPVGGQWIWVSVQLDTTAKKLYAWYSLVDSLTPSDTNADWTSIGTAAVAATATVFSGSSPLYIGALTPTGLAFEGDIGYLAYGQGVSATDPTAMTTTALRIDADNWVGLTPDASSFTPTTGGTVTINHSPSPKDTGFIELPGTKNNCLSIPDSVPLDLSGAFTIGARVNPDYPLPNYIPEQTVLSKWGVAGQRSYALQIDTEGKIVLQYSNDGTASVVLRSSQPLTFDGNPQWIVASTWVATTRNVRFWRSSDRITWTEVGTEQTHATTTIFNSTSPLIIGASFQGRISGAIINTGGGTTGVPNGTTEVLRLGSDHLNIAADSTSFPISGGTATVFRTPTPVDFGYIDFPGTVGNYLSVPDATNLRLANNFCVTARITPDDVTPQDDNRVLVRKSGAAGQLGWHFQWSTQGKLRFAYSTNGTSYATGLLSPEVPLRANFSLRVAFTYSTTLGGQFWTSDDNVKWTKLGPAATLAGTAFLSTAPVEIGVIYPGAISEVSIRSTLNADGSPKLATEVLLIDQSCLGVDPAAPTFVATTGQTVTVNRDDVSIVQGSVRFTGTLGNYLSTPDHASLDIAGNIGFIFRIAPDTWRPHVTQTFISKWDDTVTEDVGNASYLVRLSPNGTFLFSYTSLDGNTDVTMESPAVEDVVDGEFRFLALTIEFAATKTMRLWETTDFGDTWALVGAPVVETAGDATRPVGTSELIIGAQNLDVGHFAGRIAYLSIRNGVGTGGTVGTSPDAFLMDAEALHILVTDNTFTDRTGKVVTLHQANTPVLPGYLVFGGKPKEFMRTTVPAFDTTGNFTIFSRLSLAIPEGELDSEQVVIQKWNEVTPVTSGRSFSLRREGNSFTLLVSVDGTTDTINALSPDWPVEPVEATDSLWGWMAVTVMFQQPQVEGSAAVVRWFFAEDKLTPAGTPIFPETWEPWGPQRAFNTELLMHNTVAEQITLGGTELGTLPFLGSISDLLLCEGVDTGGLPGGEAQFAFNLEDFFAITSDSGAFYASTGQNVVLEPLAVARTMHIEPTPTGPALLVSPAPPGPTTMILPAPPGPTLTIQPSSPGLVAEVTASLPGPTIELSGPSLDRPWWPKGSDPDPSKWWTQPAFVVQRTVIGDVTGGDYVRGSTNVFTEQTAIRFPTRLAGWTEAGVGKGLLYTRPYWERDPYGTISVEWNFPQELIDKPGLWNEVVIVRSAMGNPLSVNDGQTIYRVTKKMLYPDIKDDGSGYLVNNDGNVLTPDIYDPHPYDPTGGQPGLPNGRWYYYGLFFLIGKDWVRSATDYTLLPRNFGHSEHLWNAVPPYYRWLDAEQGRQSDLRDYLKIFGYELDYTRELVESWQDLYHTDFTPMSLLKRIGDNFGVPYEPGIGDYCYRGLVSRVGYLYRGRGTTGALRQMIAAVGKCDCDVTQSENVLLLPDDADFYTGTGNWAGMHPNTTISGAGIPADPLAPNKIFVEHGIYNRPAPEIGRGSLHVWTSKEDATANIIVACGDGVLYFFDTHGTTDPHAYTWLSTTTAPPKEFFPRFTGSPVLPGQVYGFNISVRGDVAGVTVTPMLLFFPLTGMPEDVIPSVELPTSPTVLAANTWTKVFVSGPVPDGAQFMVPAVGLSTRPAGSDPTLSPLIHFDGASVYLLGTTEEVSSTDVDRYLTVGVTREKLGAPTEDPPYPGYLLGDQLT